MCNQTPSIVECFQQCMNFVTFSLLTYALDRPPKIENLFERKCDNRVLLLFFFSRPDIIWLKCICITLTKCTTKFKMSNIYLYTMKAVVQRVSATIHACQSVSSRTLSVWMPCWVHDVLSEVNVKVCVCSQFKYGWKARNFSLGKTTISTKRKVNNNYASSSENPGLRWTEWLEETVKTQFSWKIVRCSCDSIVHAHSLTLTYNPEIKGINTGAKQSCAHTSKMCYANGETEIFWQKMKNAID